MPENVIVRLQVVLYSASGKWGMPQSSGRQHMPIFYLCYHLSLTFPAMGSYAILNPYDVPYIPQKLSQHLWDTRYNYKLKDLAIYFYTLPYSEMTTSTQ